MTVHAAMAVAAGSHIGSLWLPWPATVKLVPGCPGQDACSRRHMLPGGRWMLLLIVMQGVLLSLMPFGLARSCPLWGLPGSLLRDHLALLRVRHHVRSYVHIM